MSCSIFQTENPRTANIRHSVFNIIKNKNRPTETEWSLIERLWGNMVLLATRHPMRIGLNSRQPQMWEQEVSDRNRCSIASRYGGLRE